MKPETEYQARLLADLILRDGGDGRDGPMAGQGMGEISVEMRGMVHGIRRPLTINGAAVAKMVADEIEAKTGAVDVRAMVAAEVAKQVADVPRLIGDLVYARMRAWLEEMIEPVVKSEAAGLFAEWHRRIRAAGQ